MGGLAKGQWQPRLAPPLPLPHLAARPGAAQGDEAAALAAERQEAERRLTRERRVLDKQSRAIMKLPSKVGAGRGAREAGGEGCSAGTPSCAQ